MARAYTGYRGNSNNHPALTVDATTEGDVARLLLVGGNGTSTSVTVNRRLVQRYNLDGVTATDRSAEANSRSPALLCTINNWTTAPTATADNPLITAFAGDRQWAYRWYAPRPDAAPIVQDSGASESIGTDVNSGATNYDSFLVTSEEAPQGSDIDSRGRRPRKDFWHTRGVIRGMASGTTSKTITDTVWAVGPQRRKVTGPTPLALGATPAATTTQPPNVTNRTPAADDEALYGVSTSFFEHIGTSAKVTGRRAGNRANNRQTSPGRAALNVTFGAITARGAPRSQVGSQFAAPYTLVDVILGYDPQARDDPEEYERLLFARPRTQTPLDVVVIPPPNPPPVIASNRGDPLEDESLLGTSTSFFVHFREGQKKSNTFQRGTLNNRWTSPGRPSENLYFGAISARNAPAFFNGNLFGTPYTNNDVIYGYNPQAQDDPEEYERLLYARPRALTPLAAPVAPPPENPPPIIATGARGFDEGPRPTRIVQALQFTADPTPPTIESNTYRIDDEALYGTSITAGDQGTDTVRPLGRPNPDSSRNNRWIGYKQEASKHFLNAIRARSAPGFFKGGVGAEILEYWPQFVYEAEELPHRPSVIQPPLVVTVAPPNPPPVIVSGLRSFDEGPRPEKVVQALQFTADPVPPAFESNRTPAETLPHPPEVIQPPLGVFVPPPNPPPVIASGLRSFDEGPRPTKVVQALTFTPAPVPPALIIGPRGTDEGARPTRVIQAPLGVAPPTGMFTGPISARSTWTILPDGLTLFVTPGRFQDPPDPVGGVNRLAPRFLPFTPAPTPPPFTGAPRGFDEGSRPETVWDWSIRYTPAPVPPPFATGRRGFDEGPRPQRLFQAPPFVPPAALIRPEVDQMGGGPDVDQLVRVGDSRPSSSTGDADALGVTGDTDSTGRGTEYG